MPRIKRWFPVSRDIFSDPQVTELITQFGHKGLVVWLAFLKMAEDDQGAILSPSYKALAGSLASLARIDQVKAQKILAWFISCNWANQEWYESSHGSSRLVFRATNYSRYHPQERMRPILSFSTPPRPSRRTSFKEGEQRLNQAGYAQIFKNGRWRMAHHVVVEAALGKPLPPGAQVHHINGNKTLNEGSNLVVCQDASYHNLLHRRTSDRFEIDVSGRFIRKERGSYSNPRGNLSLPLLPSYLPTEPLKNKNKSPETNSRQWVAEDFWLRDLLEQQTWLSPNGYLHDPLWWEALAIELNGINPDWLRQQLAKMQAWCIENPKRKPTARGVKRFIRTWLERSAEERRRNNASQQRR